MVLGLLRGSQGFQMGSGPGPHLRGPTLALHPTHSSDEKRCSQGGGMLVQVLALTCMACWNR